MHIKTVMLLYITTKLTILIVNQNMTHTRTGKYYEIEISQHSGIYAFVWHG